MKSPPHGHARRDLAWVLGVAVGVFALSGAFELHERLALIALRFEAWQVDELPFTLTVLSLGLAWFAWRRRREVAVLLARNRELARQLIGVQESERRALARELHDELAQHCTAIRIEAAYIQRARDAEQVAASAQRSAATAELLYEGVRRLLRRLRPAELDELGLVAALQSLCESCETRSRLRCRLRHHGELQSLGEAVDTAIYRVTLETLSNAIRHAQATQVVVTLIATPTEIALQIEDDGRGFEAGSATRGLGLLGAGERAAALGGELRLTSTPGSGTRIRLTLPLALETEGVAA
jgi:two-component system sensor histidine kinase UhpB